jgi:MFS family permease
MALIDASIVMIAMPTIVRGIGLDPFAAGNITYLLWMIMGYLLVQAVLVVSLGRLGDMYGRVRIYNLGFVVFTAASMALSFDPFTAGQGAMWLIGWRVAPGTTARSFSQRSSTRAGEFAQVDDGWVRT